MDEIPEPHAFTANVRTAQDTHPVAFEEHEHAQGSAARDNNMRAAVIHASLPTPPCRCLSIVGLLLASHFWMALDGPARRHHGGLRHRQLVLWPRSATPERVLLGHEPQIGAWRARWRQAVEGDGDKLARSSPLALGSGAPRRDCFRSSRPNHERRTIIECASSASRHCPI